MNEFACHALLRCIAPRSVRSVDPTISTPLIFLEVVGCLTSECVDAIHQILDGPQFTNSKLIAISVLRLSGTQWGAALRLVERCKDYLRDGRHVVLLGEFTTPVLFNSIEPTLTWGNSLARLTIAQHIIVAHRLRTKTPV
jgi:hypothetical protein